MLPKILQKLLIAALAAASAIKAAQRMAASKECLDVVKNLTHPSRCCSYPTARIDAIDKQCEEFCRSEWTTNRCCTYGCFENASGVVRNEEVNKEAMINLMLNSIENLTSLEGGREKWKTVIEDSYDQCHNITLYHYDWNETSKYIGHRCNNTSAQLYFIKSCMLEKNFIGCPFMRSVPQCDAVRQFALNATQCYVKLFAIKVMYVEFWYNWSELRVREEPATTTVDPANTTNMFIITTPNAK